MTVSEKLQRMELVDNAPEPLPPGESLACSPHPPSASLVGPSCYLTVPSPEKQQSQSSVSLQGWLP